MRREIHELNWKSMRSELNNLLSDRYRTVWLEYSKLGNICITCFENSASGGYKIFIMKNQEVENINVENIMNFVLSN
jgi:hypothetical protein